jgi:hypothetical protein
MVDLAFYRQLARQCRALLKVARDPDLFAQLETWALECDRRADVALRERPSGDIREQAKRYQHRGAEYRAVADQMQNPTACASLRHLAETYEGMARRLEMRADRKNGRDGRETG